MKKNILVSLLALLPLFAFGQNHRSASFIAPYRAIQVPYNAGYTNDVPTGLLVTNVFGVQATNSALDALKSIDMWTDKNGSFHGPVWANTSATDQGTNSYVVAAAQTWSPANSTLFIKLVGTNAGANSAVTFVFAPKPDGVNASTTAADLFSVAVTAAGTTPVTLMTNLPSYRWVGVKSVELLRIQNADTDNTANVWVTSCSLNGFVP